MARTTINLGLRLWDQLLDDYNNQQLADNFAKIDVHDHSPGRGVQISAAGLAAGVGAPGVWQPLSLVGGVTTAGGDGYTASARIEQDFVRLKGSLDNNTGSSISSNTTLAILPSSSLYPTTTYGIEIPVFLAGSSTPGVLAISNAGAISFSLAIPTGTFIRLDGITYTLS